MEEENGDDGEASAGVRCRLRETRMWSPSVRPRLRVGMQAKSNEGEQRGEQSASWIPRHSFFKMEAVHGRDLFLGT